MPKKVMFLCTKCALDKRNGAARQSRNILQALSEAGWEAKSLTMTFFDGRNEFPLQRLWGAETQKKAQVGTIQTVTSNDVEHNLFVTRGTVMGKVSPQEFQEFLRTASSVVQDEQPDVVITFGNGPPARQIANIAGAVCRSLVFLLVNPSYTEPDLFAPFDEILMASHFLAEHYYHLLGITGTVLPSYILPEARVEPQEVLGVQYPSARKHGFITFINPSIEKGGTLFWRLAKLAAEERPDLEFLCVEGRMSDKDWAKAGFDIAQLPNVWWIPNQDDVRPIYARTSILLFPSFWNEPSGGSIAEAQLAGIPILGANHSGIPEQLNGGGVLFDIPNRCRKKFTNIPTESEVRPWLNVISQLMDDDQTYLEASNVALQAAKKFEPDMMKKRIIELFENLPQTTGPRTQIDVLPPDQRSQSSSELEQKEDVPCSESIN
jgi:glycosyltransferase involved in cell wall biosynthesis